MTVGSFLRLPEQSDVELAQSLFSWLSHSASVVDRMPPPQTLQREQSDPLWQSLVEVAQLILQESQVQSHALRHAFRACLNVFSRRSMSHKFEMELSSIAMSVAENRKQPINARHFALSIIESVALLPKDGVHLIARNIFPLIVTIFSSASGSATAQKSPNYRLTLVRVLLAIRKAADGAMLQEQDVKAAWRLCCSAAQSSAQEPNGAQITVACWQLLAELASPEIVNTQSKFDKLVALYDKHASQHRSLEVRNGSSKALAEIVKKFELLAEGAAQLQQALNSDASGSAHKAANADDDLKFGESKRGSNTKIAAAAAAAAVSGGPNAISAALALKLKLTIVGFMEQRLSVYTDATTTARQSQSLAMLFEHLLQQMSDQDLSNETTLGETIDILLHMPAQRLTRWRYAAAKAHSQHLVCSILLQQKLTTDKARVSLFGMLSRKLEATAPTKSDVLAALLAILTRALTQLGPALPFSAHVQLASVLDKLLESNCSSELRSDAAKTLEQLVTVSPRLLANAVAKSLDRATKFRDEVCAKLCAKLLVVSDKNILYSSSEQPEKVLQSALALLRAGQKELNALKCGWELIAGVVSLNTQSVRALMPQLLILWLPSEESNFTALQTYAASLDALHSLLTVHSSLVTPDVAKTAASIATAAWALSDKATGQEASHVEQQVMAIYAALSGCANCDVPASLLTRAVQILSEAGKLAQNCEFGINGRNLNIRPVKHAAVTEQNRVDNVLDAANNVGFGISSLAVRQIVASSGFDSLESIHQIPFESLDILPLPTKLVDSSLQLLVQALPFQSLRVQESLLDKLRVHCENLSQLENPIAEAALLNTGYFLTQFMQNCLSAELFTNDRAIKAIESLAMPLLRSKYYFVRSFGAQALGALAAACPLRVAQLAIYCLDMAVSERQPEIRAGFALALGSVLNSGSVQAQAPEHLLRVTKALLQFTRDPNVVVHTAAFKALDGVVAAAGMRAHDFAKALVDTLFEVCVYESHNSAESILGAANLLTTAVSVLGPELAGDKNHLAKAAALIQLFSDESDENCVAAGWLCWQELLYFARDNVDIVRVVKTWAREINQLNQSGSSAKRNAAISGISNLFSLTSSRILAILGSDFERALWAAFDADPLNEALRDLLQNWLEQTCSREPEKWIMRLSAVVMKPKYVFENTFGSERQSKSSTATNKSSTEADEDESLGVHGDEVRTELLSLSTRQYATEQLLVLVKQQLRDQTTAVKQRCAVVQYLGDIVRIAFSAATSSALSMQLAGLELLDELVSELADLVDPEFPETKLLAQFQAQISPALTPAFSSESSPQLALSALKVCASYIGSGIVTNADKFGRMLRIVSASAATMDSFSLGQVELSENGSHVLKIGVLRLWAELAAKMHKPHREYLCELVNPQLEMLSKQWETVLCEYARLRFAPAASTTRSLAESLDALTHAETQYALLPIYQGAWLDLVTALADTQPQETLAKVLFGLCFEQLVQAVAKEERKAAIKALASILEVPAVADEAANEDARHELVSALARVSLTGDAVEQAGVTSAIKNMCCRPEIEKMGSEFLTQCVHLCAMPLVQRLQKPGEHVWTDVELDLASESLEALVKLAGHVASHTKLVESLALCVLQIFYNLSNTKSAQQVLLPHVFAKFRELMLFVGSSEFTENCRHSLEQAVSRFFIHSVATLADTSDVVTKRNRALEGMVVLVYAAPLLHSERSRNAAAAFGEWVGSRIETKEDGLSAVLHECVRAVFASQSMTVRDPASVAFVSGALPALCGCLATSDLQGTAADTPKLVCNVTVRWATLSEGKDSAGAICLAGTALSHVRTLNWLTPRQRILYTKTLLLALASSHPTEFGDWFRSQSADEQVELRFILERSDEQEEPEDAITLTQL